jgi:ectoine hydroxylase
MLLTDAEVAEFAERGWVLRQGVFGPEELAVLEGALAEVADPGGADAVIDQASGTVRMVHGSHRTSAAFGRLARHPRVVGPAERLLGGPTFVYQSRLNLKEGFRGAATGGYPWHQDFSTWHLRDGLPEPRAVVTFTFLDDVTPCNAPLMVIPGSHRDGMLGTPERQADGSYAQVLIPPAVLGRLAETEGVTAVTAPAGSLLLMHANLVHGSTENISPLRRALYCVVYSAVDNRPRQADRPERYASRDEPPVEALADDCLFA